MAKSSNSTGGLSCRQKAGAGLLLLCLNGIRLTVSDSAKLIVHLSFTGANAARLVLWTSRSPRCNARPSPENLRSLKVGRITPSHLRHVDTFFCLPKLQPSCRNTGGAGSLPACSVLRVLHCEPRRPVLFTPGARVVPQSQREPVISDDFEIRDFRLPNSGYEK
jgi:hypothetical protein